MAIVSSSVTERGIRAEFFQRFGEVGRQTYWQDLTTRIPSTKDSEKFAFLGSVPQLREWGTGRVAKGLVSESYEVQNLKYEATLEVDRDTIADSEQNMVIIRCRELADRAATHKDYLIGQLLMNGATAGFNSYDSQPFFSATHASGDSGAQDNDLTSAIVDKDSPTAAELRLAISSDIAAMMSFVDDQGHCMALSATGLNLIVPPSMLIPASEAVNATLVSTGGTNVLAGAARVIGFPWLAAETDRYYILKTDAAVRPLIFLDREPIEWRAREADSDTGFLREVYLYGVRARYRVTYGYWQYAIRHVFTTA